MPKTGRPSVLPPGRVAEASNSEVVDLTASPLPPVKRRRIGVAKKEEVEDPMLDGDDILEVDCISHDSLRDDDLVEIVDCRSSQTIEFLGSEDDIAAKTPEKCEPYVKEIDESPVVDVLDETNPHLEVELPVTPDLRPLDINQHSSFVEDLAGPEEINQPPRPSAEVMLMTVNCIIPGQESTTEIEWETTRIFYKLEKVYGRNAVLSYKGEEIQKFKNPVKAAKDLSIYPTDLVLTISTDRQLKDIQWRMQQAASGQAVEEEETVADNRADSQAEKFPITLQGKAGALRVLVSSASKIEELLHHYLETKAVTCSAPSARFDGDRVDPSQTVGDLDMEEDDNLDIYT